MQHTNKSTGVNLLSSFPTLIFNNVLPELVNQFVYIMVRTLSSKRSRGLFLNLLHYTRQVLFQGLVTQFRKDQKCQRVTSTLRHYNRKVHIEDRPDLTTLLSSTCGTACRMNAASRHRQHVTITAKPWWTRIAPTIVHVVSQSLSITVCPAYRTYVARNASCVDPIDIVIYAEQHIGHSQRRSSLPACQTIVRRQRSSE